jgi:hypothetical protein
VESLTSGGSMIFADPRLHPHPSPDRLQASARVAEVLGAEDVRDSVVSTRAFIAGATVRSASIQQSDSGTGSQSREAEAGREMWLRNMERQAEVAAEEVCVLAAMPHAVLVQVVVKHAYYIIALCACRLNCRHCSGVTKSMHGSESEHADWQRPQALD